MTSGYRASGSDATVERWDFDRRDLRPDDVRVRVTHCGVCHSDLHALRSHASNDDPLVPGHEFVGEVAAVGSDVTSFTIGDPVAVGNIVDSCGVCDMCVLGQENFCREAPTLTYGGVDRIDGSPTWGAWASDYVVRERFVYRRDPALEPAGVAPLLCAGITVWEPLRAWDVKEGTRLGVVGLGGLGHLAVKLGHALGATVTVFTTTPAKADDAMRLGADRVVTSSDDEAMSAARGELDLIIDCVAVPHDLAPYLATLALDGTLCLVGDLGSTTISVLDLLIGRKSLSSAGSGGVPRTQELLDFCAAHGITADVEVLPSSHVDDALARLADGDVRYRFVLELADLA